MANRYYLVDLGPPGDTRQTRIQNIRDRLPDEPGRRERAMDRLHWARSDDGRYLLAQVEMNDQEFAQLPSWVTPFADVEAVHAYKLANPDIWYPEFGTSTTEAP